jgi:hypothetical protein
MSQHTPVKKIVKQQAERVFNISRYAILKFRSNSLLRIHNLFFKEARQQAKRDFYSHPHALPLSYIPKRTSGFEPETLWLTSK